jgi:hypothetical protein
MGVSCALAFVVLRHRSTIRADKDTLVLGLVLIGDHLEDGER